MPTARIDDIDITYEVTDFTDPWTRPQTILLHHGFSRSLRFWHAWVPLLCRDYRVVTMSSRGNGGSMAPPEGFGYSLDRMSDDAVGLLDVLGIERAHWGGEASGGIVGLNTAARHPPRIASLTLCNTPIKPPRATHDFLDEARVRKLGVGDWASETAPWRIDVDKVSPEYLAWSNAEHDLTPPHVAIGVHRMLGVSDIRPALSQVRAPTLVLAGESSAVAPIEQVREMERLIPGAKVVVFPGYSQGVAYSNPEGCVAEMRAFLNALPATA